MNPEIDIENNTKAEFFIKLLHELKKDSKQNGIWDQDNIIHKPTISSAKIVETWLIQTKPKELNWLPLHCI